MTMGQTTSHASRLRILTTLALALAVVLTAVLLPSSATKRTGTLAQANEQIKAADGLPHTDPPGSPVHTHDPRTKNDLARGGEVGAQTEDPTTARQAARSAAYVASQRRLPDPRLRTAAITRPLTRYPADRYAAAHGCYTLRTTAGAYLQARSGGTYALARTTRARATGLRFQATRLGEYLLYSRDRRYLATSDGVALDTRPSSAAEWRVRTAGRSRGVPRYVLDVGGRSLRASGSRLVLGRAGTPFVLEQVGGCALFPESQVGVSGRPHAGVTAYQEVRGFVDAHTHHMAFEFLGGQVHCGRPWHEYGITAALVDCPDHTLTGGKGAALEAVLSGVPSHDPVGWPTFEDWPAPESLTHEGTYYRWMERAWRGGERLFVNLLVENNKLCEVYPLKRNSCDDMDSVRLQARRMHEFENYVDAQFGGPGRGFYRIVRNPFEARRVINAGKMAVVMGIETSVPFGCTFKAVPGGDVPACTRADITRQVSEMHRIGVRQMELVNKFDNALAGVAGDAGPTGVAINGANFLETGSFWDMRSCRPSDGESADRTQLALPGGALPEQDAIFGAITQLFGGVLPAVPLYGPPAHCNARGLTDLGTHTIDELISRKMIFDPDHLSVKARRASMDQIELRRYPGVVSSHSWSTPDTYPRIYRAGGFITPYAGDSTGFVQKWRRHLGWADPRFYYGIGFGADINGLGAQGDPRGANVANKVTYPFRGLGGVTIDRQRTGRRVFDINRDGVAQYGLYPDWIQDLKKVAGRQGSAIYDDMTRGPEAYLQMWERAEGIRPDSCRNPSLRLPVAQVERLVRRGLTTRQVMARLGQPYQRLGTTYTVCARQPGRPRVRVEVRFDRGGRVTGLEV